MLEHVDQKRKRFRVLEHASCPYINEEITKIKANILNSELASTYMKYNYSYKNKRKEDTFSLISCDWNFCILICKFMKCTESLPNMVLILEHFLYDHRYHSKFDNDSTYLQLTISKVITLCTKDSLIGALRPNYGVEKVYSDNIKSNVKIIDKKVVFKVSRCFYFK